MSTIRINGVTYSGSSVTVINNRVIIDGKDQTPDAKEITITVQGDINDLSVDYAKSVTVTGNVNRLKTTSGDVECGDVKGDVITTSGDIECKNITGNVQSTSGDIDAENIGGSIKTLSGDIKYRK